MPLPHTDVEVVAYRVKVDDLMVLVNRGGVCDLRTILAGEVHGHLDLIKANVHMTEQHIGVGVPPESMQEMIGQCWRRSDHPEPASSRAPAFLVVQDVR